MIETALSESNSIPIKWQDILTIPDESLVGEGSVDPMGMQMIWSDFGQKIFNYKLTTVSNDIRNFTINLFNHYVIRQLSKNNPGFFHDSIRKYSSYVNEAGVKSGILIFLEDLLVHCLIHLKFDLKEDIDLFGLLGSNKAEQQYHSDKESILLKADRNGGVLVRQIVLGINGRYKGPFLSMGLISNRSYVYNETLWGPADKLFVKWNDSFQLALKLVNILEDLFISSYGSYPEKLFSSYRNDHELLNLYKNCFGKLAVTPELKDFWEEKTGLTDGAAKALYQQIILDGEKSDAVIFEEAESFVADDEEKTKLQNIISMEQFLSVCTQLFYNMTDPSTKSLDPLIDDVKKIIHTVDLQRVLPLYSLNSRLAMLIDHYVEGENDPIQTLIKIAEYHYKVMQQRGNYPWIEIIKQNQVRHFTYQKPRFTTDEFIRLNPWYHSYYLPTLRSIYKTLYNLK